ncbi:MAG: hypothetical protein V9E94_14615 [Microthrixaceae bacterium]
MSILAATLGDGDRGVAHPDDPVVFELESVLRRVAGGDDERLDPEVDARVTGPASGDHEGADELVVLPVVVTVALGPAGGGVERVRWRACRARLPGRRGSTTNRGVVPGGHVDVVSLLSTGGRFVSPPPGRCGDRRAPAG